MSAKLRSYLPSVGPDTTDAQRVAAAKTEALSHCHLWGLQGTHRHFQKQTVIKKPKLQMK